MEEILNLKKVRKIYNPGKTEVVAVNDLDFVVQDNEFVAIQGVSGSGKSTLLHLIGGMDNPTAGEICAFGKDIGKNCCYHDENSIFYKQNGQTEEIIKLCECTLIGEHNYQNIECAIICAKLAGIDNNTITECIKNFKAPAHRLEYVAEKDGTAFYNDSKGTNP